MIEFTEAARKYIRERKIENILITIRYVQGPCNDNLCKMIPKLEVKTVLPQNITMELVSDDFVKIFAMPPAAASIRNNRGNIRISLSRLKKTLRIEGVPYTL